MEERKKKEGLREKNEDGDISALIDSSKNDVHVRPVEHQLAKIET